METWIQCQVQDPNIWHLQYLNISIINAYVFKIVLQPLKVQHIPKKEYKRFRTFVMHDLVLV